MVVGEIASQDDELLGEPFMSREGDYLRKLLHQAGLPPEDCYLTLTVKCPVPDPKGATEDQIQACRPWLFQELETVRPQLVLSLGTLPARILLGEKKSFRLNRVVGQMQRLMFPWSGSVMPWYSPSYLLQRGKKMEQQTLSLLQQLKARLV